MIVLLVQYHNGRSKILHQLLCRIHDETDLLQISLVNDSKIELRAVFGHRLVCGTHREQTFLRFK